MHSKKTEETKTGEETALDNEIKPETENNAGEETGGLAAQLSELQDKYLRLMAEFDNFRKRSVRERLDMIHTASKDTLSSLLPILDDFDRAQKNETFSEGVNLVYQKLYNILQQKGLRAMESTGIPFDPEFHEAITEIPAPTEDQKGLVIDTLEKGYMLHDKIIRYAKVVVGK